MKKHLEEQDLSNLYGTPEEFLKYLQENNHDCDFCNSRIEWLANAISLGLPLSPPYLEDDSLKDFLEQDVI